MGESAEEYASFRFCGCAIQRTSLLAANLTGNVAARRKAREKEKGRDGGEDRSEVTKRRRGPGERNETPREATLYREDDGRRNRGREDFEAVGKTVLS